MKDLRMNVIVLFMLTVFTFGVYGLIWLARTSRAFKDDPLTVVVLSPLGLFPFFFLRYMGLSHKLNGREMPWYEAFFFLFGFVIIQMNLNEYIAKKEQLAQREQ